MEPDSPFNFPRSSFQSPAPLLTVEPDDVPLVLCLINEQWLAYLRGCAKQLLLETTWDTDDPDALNLAQMRAFNLIDLLGNPTMPIVLPGDSVQIDRINNTVTISLDESTEGINLVDNANVGLRGFVNEQISSNASPPLNIFLKARGTLTAREDITVNTVIGNTLFEGYGGGYQQDCSIRAQSEDNFALNYHPTGIWMTLRNKANSFVSYLHLGSEGLLELFADTFGLRTSKTPTGTADASGAIGDICRDDNYVYVKTASGWKRASLSTF